MTEKLFVFGCSHAGRLLRGAQILGFDAAGGGLMRGRYWDEGRFDFSDAGGLTFEDSQANERLAAALGSVGAKSLAELDMPIVTTLGFQFDIVLAKLAEEFALEPDGRRDFLPADIFADYVIERRSRMVALIGWLVGRGKTVVAVSPPPRFQPTALAAAFEDVVLTQIEAVGARVHRTRDWAAGDDGLLQPRFASPRPGDRVHGNSLFGAHAIAWVAATLGLEGGADLESIEAGALDLGPAERRRALRG